MTDLFSVPRVGVGVVILNNEGKVLIGKRMGSIGAGTYALPGGHLEFGESLEDCARRETLEETGLELGDISYGTLTESIMVADNRHYVTIFMIGRPIDKEGNEPKNLEPNKCEGWGWYHWEDIPSPKFAGLGDLVTKGWRPSV